ncbi:alpha/beta family hydrolase [Thalassotalea euphylliae]|uniref:alpha/beta family hydrolase n=1 Tax=Thalassotalea euphylliae TaxID=1655234 RepID=UPI003643D819
MTTTTIYQHAESAKALLVLAHGAGADKSSEFMEAIASELLKENISVLRFNFPYMDKRLEDGKKRPPERMPKLFPCFAEHINSVETGLPIFLGGKSMGGRVAATLTSQLEDVSEFSLNKKVCGVVCLGYPFHPIGKPETLRLNPLTDRALPVRIIQGTRDAMGNSDEVKQYTLPSLVSIDWLEDGNHDLKPRVKSGFTHSQHISAAAKFINHFVEQELSHA